MKDQETIQKFIELRSQGWSYARLMAELNLSKPTLINWSRQLQEATGSVRFTTPIAEIPGDEFHHEVHDWQG